MTRFRQRISEAGCEQILKLAVQAGLQSKTIKPSDLERVIVDTTVQETAVSFHRQQATESLAGALGEVVSPARCVVAPELRAQRC